MSRLQDRIAIISGAASQIGIGRAIALAYAREGARLVLLDVDSDGLEATAESCRGLGVEALAVACDVAYTDAVDDAVQQALDRFGRIDVLASNAGIARLKPFVDLTDADIDQVMGVNFGGTARLIRAVAPGMLERGAGSIVCISSIAGSPWGWKDHAPYSASKAAIEGLVRALAVEFGPAGVRVNAIAPGAVRTHQTLDEVNSVGEAGLESLPPRVPLRRVGRPEDIATLAVVLAGEDSAYVTGQTLIADGGITLGLLA